MIRKLKRRIHRTFRRLDRSILRGFQRFFRLAYKLKPLRPLLRPMYRFTRVHYRLTASLLTVLVIASVAVPVLQRYYTSQKYVLGREAQALLGGADTDLTKKLTFNAATQTYQFNKDAERATFAAGKPIPDMKNQVGGSGANDEQLYSMDAPRDLSKGVTYYDNQMDLNFKITPQFGTLPAEIQEGHLVYPLIGSSGQVAYTVEATGLKQNVVLYSSPGDALNMSYKLDLPNTLEAKMIDETGEVGIYSVDPSALSSIDTNASDAVAKIEQARTEPEKTYLVFKIPAPVVMAQGKIDQAGIGNIKSHFLLNDNVLTVMTTGLDKAEYPLAIDPTVSIDSASEFGSGSVEDNNLTLASGNATRNGLSGGGVPSWSTTTVLPGYWSRQVSVAYNGYMYNIAGTSNVGQRSMYAAINSDGTIGSWNNTTTSAPNNGCYASGAAYNGYIYIVGGTSNCDLTLLSTVNYAPIDSSGNISTAWQSATSLPAGLINSATVAYKGYLYAIGGYDGAVGNFVRMAPIKADGSLGSWSSTTTLGTARYAHQSAVYNDYIYAYGGLNASDAALNTVEYAPINTDGTVGTWATTSSFTTARHSFRGFAYNGHLYITGGDDTNVYLSNVQYASINANGTLGAWVTSTALPAVRWRHTAVAYNGYIYVMGGMSASSVNQPTVYYAKVNDPGGVAGTAFTAGTTFSGTNGARYAFGSAAYNGYMYIMGGVSGSSTVRYSALGANGANGAWTTNANALDVARQWFDGAAYNGYLYAVGGWNGSSMLNNVSYAAINNNGSVGTWSTLGSTFTNGRDSHAVTVYNGYLYVLGGYSGTSTTTYNDVQYAPINANGTLGTWQSTSSFTTARSDLEATVYNGYMYISGGQPFNDGTNLLSDVQYAPINANGTLGTWQTTTSFSTARQGHSSTIYNGVMYIIAGDAGSGGRSDIQYTPINTNGTVGTWATTTSITQNRRKAEVVAYNGYIYVLGGMNDSTNATNTVYYAALNNGGPGTTGTWTSTSSFTNTRYGHGSVAYNGYMYILGGFNGTAYADIQYAVINSTNGTLGSWNSAGSDFATARYGLATFVNNGYIYVLGGTSNGSNYFNDVQYAPINTNGTIGTWQTTTSFGTARYGHHIEVYNGYVYLTGGNSGSTQNDVQFAPISANGTLGSWGTTTAFTNARYGHDTTINNGYMYILGGQNASTYYNDVQVAQIQNDGTLGSWTSLTPFNNVRYGLDSFVYNGYLYVTGGYNGISYYSDVQYAPLAPNGHLGQWQTTTAFTTARYVHTSLAYNGYMYVLGGNSGSYLNTVYYAPMNIMSRKATYSKVLSFGTNSKITGVAYTGNLIDGLQNIRYRFANGAGTFPTTAPRAANLSFTCDAGVNVQVLATLDNSTSSVFPDSAGSPGQISSITVTYAVPGVEPNKRLRHGGYFSSEQLQPFDTSGCS